MTGASGSLERRQEQRYAVLKHMYVVVEETNNSEKPFFEAGTIATALPYPEQEIESALTYLAGEHLAKKVGQTRLNGAKRYELTHQGVKEIERSLQTPNEATEHFSTQIVQHFHGTVGAVPTGIHATAVVTQNVGASYSDVFGLIERIKSQIAELPQEQQEGASDSIEALEDELKSQNKNPKRVRGLLAGLKGIAQGTVTFSSQVATLVQKLKDLGVF